MAKRDSSTWYRNTPQGRAEYNKYQREYRHKKKDELIALKAKYGCADCGYDNGIALQFHHTTADKSFTIGKIGWRKSKEDLETEIAKCVILCANCHILRHFRPEVL